MIQIQENDTDPADTDPQHWVAVKGMYILMSWVRTSIQVESTQNRGKYNTVYLVQDKTIVDDGERKRGGGVQ